MMTDQNGYLVNKTTHSSTSPVDLQSVISMEILESDMSYVDVRSQDVSEDGLVLRVTNELFLYNVFLFKGGEKNHRIARNGGKFRTVFDAASKRV